MRVPNWLSIAVALLTYAFAPLAQSAPPEPSPSAHIKKEVLVGAWRLVRIDFSGPNGPLTDPFFGPSATGIIIYDPSGWMSVQIVGANRPTQIARTRTSTVDTPEDIRHKASALDTYYAYFGTWEYDSEKSTIQHHLEASLLPYETGVDLQREVKFDGKYLSLIVRRSGGQGTRELVWERVSGPINK